MAPNQQKGFHLMALEQLHYLKLMLVCEEGLQVHPMQGKPVLDPLKL